MDRSKVVESRQDRLIDKSWWSSIALPLLAGTSLDKRAEVLLSTSGGHRAHWPSSYKLSRIYSPRIELRQPPGPRLFVCQKTIQQCQGASMKPSLSRGLPQKQQESDRGESGSTTGTLLATSCSIPSCFACLDRGVIIELSSFASPVIGRQITCELHPL